MKTSLLSCALVLAFANPLLAESWVGRQVMPRKEAVFTVGDKQIDSDLVAINLTVEAENGDWLWVGRAWVKRAHVVPLEDAPAYYTDFIRSNPNDFWAFNSRGTAWQSRGEFENAIKDFTEAIRQDPEDASAYSNRGSAWADLDDYDKAIDDYNEALRLDPTYASGYMDRGRAWFSKRQYDKAITDHNESIRLNPTDAKAYWNRGNAWVCKKRYDKAIADYNEALRLDPTYAWAYDRRAWLRATAVDGKHRDGEQAVTDATKANELTSWKDADMLDTLGAAYAESGDFGKAIEWQTKARDLGSNEEFLKGACERLELYRQGQPYRETDD